MSRDEQTVEARKRRSEALFRRLRWQLPISFGCVMVALAIIAVQRRDRWSWPLFAWGIVIGIVGVVLIELALRAASRLPEVSNSDRQRVMQRLPTYRLCWIAGGLIIGTIAASFDHGWIDIVGAAYSATSLGVGLIIFLVFRRRLRARDNAHGSG